MRLSNLFLLLCLISCGTTSAQDAPSPSPGNPADIPLAHFLDPDNFGSLKLSPDAAHFAATVPMGDRTVLVILRRSDMKQTAVVSPEETGHVVEFTWVNPDQVVYSVATKSGSRDRPVMNPFLYIVDAEGGNPRPIDRGMPMSLWDDLPAEDDVILVDAGYRVGRHNLRTGKFESMRNTAPVGGYWNIDNAGKLRLVRGYMANELYPRLYVQGPDEKWVLINNENVTRLPMYVAGFSADNRLAYLQVEETSGPDSFQALDLQTLERSVVSRHERVDVSSVLHSPVTGAVIAVVYQDGKPRVEYIDKEDFHARELMKLSLAFPDSYVYPTSYTRDGKQAVYFVSSDVNSGEYYLMDHATGKAQFIAARSDKLDPRLMSPMTPFRFKARDGLEIDGLLTRPRSWPEGKPGPLVVMPHGGPKGPFDTWGFDSEIQMLASRGYAVLQVNFCGSGNYGRSFRNAGDRQWGRKMQDDLTDATRWAIEQGHAAPGRICIYGYSYGAYAAMMGLVREPDLYACGIGNIGVYDMPQLYREETTGTRAGQVVMDEMLGSSDLRSISPPALVDRIRAPVLLGAGGKDYTAPINHTRNMRRALENAKLPVETIVYPKEGHGYYDVANRSDWANRVLALLGRTIGQGAPAPAPAPTPAPSP